MSADVSLRHPHSFRMLTVRGIYLRLSIAVAVPLVAGLVRSGGTGVFLVAAALLGALVAELAMQTALGRLEQHGNILNGRAVYFALTAVALVPAGTAAPVLGVAAALGILLGLWLPGGPGAYWLHPAALGLLLVPSMFAGSGAPASLGVDAEITAAIESSGAFRALDETVFEPLGMNVTPAALAALTGLMSETSVSLTAGLVLPMMVGAMIVFGEDFYPWVLPAGFFAAFFMAVEAAGGEVLSLTLSSNAPFVGLFLLADPGIRPAHRVGMALFGVFAGLAAGLLLVSSATMLPVVAGTLIACTFRPLIDRALVRRTWR